MGMVPRRPLREHSVVFLQADVVDRVFVDGAVGNVRNGTARDQEPHEKLRE